MDGMDASSIGFLTMVLGICYMGVKEEKNDASDILVICGFITVLMGAIIEVLGKGR